MILWVKTYLPYSCSGSRFLILKRFHRHNKIILFTVTIFVASCQTGGTKPKTGVLGCNSTPALTQNPPLNTVLKQLLLYFHSRVTAADWYMRVMMMMATRGMQQSRLTLKDVSVAGSPWQRGRWIGLDWVEFNAPPDTVEVISEGVFTANHNEVDGHGWIVCANPTKSNRYAYLLPCTCIGKIYCDSVTLCR